MFTTDFEREAVRLRVGRTEFGLAVDRGVIRAETRNGGVEEPICEAEFELVSGNPTRMLDVALELCEAYNVRLGHMTKAERGYALARPVLRPRPKKAAGVEIFPETSVGGAFGIVIGSALEHLFGNEVPTLSREAEGVHQTRVAMRRVRAALRAFKGALPYDKRKAFNGEFRWFQQRLAPARDWQVFLSETLPKIALGAQGEDESTRRLLRVARAERRRALDDDVAAFLRGSPRGEEAGKEGALRRAVFPLPVDGSWGSAVHEAYGAGAGRPRKGKRRHGGPPHTRGGEARKARLPGGRAGFRLVGGQGGRMRPCRPAAASRHEKDAAVLGRLNLEAPRGVSPRGGRCV